MVTPQMVTPQLATSSSPPAALVRPPAMFELIALEGLPCGCVAAAYRADPWDFGVICLEAKGPHCVYGVHRQGRVLRLGKLEDLIDEDEEE